jgi:hypothetical protein
MALSEFQEDIYEFDWQRRFHGAEGRLTQNWKNRRGFQSVDDTIS